MMGDYHVRFCEGLGGKFPWSTRHLADASFCETRCSRTVNLRAKIRDFWRVPCAALLAKERESVVPSRPGELPP